MYVAESTRTTLWWQGLAYLLLTLAEILISVTGLEMAFVVAPARMKGFVTSLWLLTVFLANFALNAPLGQLYPHMHPGTYFAMLAGMMGVVMVVFFFIARDYNRLVALENLEKDRAIDADSHGHAPNHELRSGSLGTHPTPVAE